MRKSALISIVLVAMMFSTCFNAYAGGEVYYTVRPGDTLYGIGQKFGLSHRAIIKSNGLSSALILPGTNLNIPGTQSMVHTVKPGENLHRISGSYGVKVPDVMKASGLTSTLIRPGMKLVIPSGSFRGNTNQVKPVFSSKFSLTKEDIRLLAKLIHAEARGESLQGQVAVGAVILNRLASGEFPDNLRDVIFQKTKGVYQFTPVRDGQIHREPNEMSFSAAERALKGEDPTGGSIFFYNPETSSDRWIKTLPVQKVIGNHVFAK